MDETIPRGKYYGLLLCFFFSGCAGLIYQVAWTKALGLIFGHTVYAIATVLAAFMGGLALGAAVLGRWGDRHPNPVALYGWIELLIAVTGGLSLVGVQLVRAMYLASFPVVSGSEVLLVGLRFLGAGLVLLIPTFLMGGTLPILVRGVTRGSAELGERLGRLYWVNTAGAVAGTLLAGFLLLPQLGLRATVALAVVLNIIAGGVALMLRRTALPSLEAAPAKAVPASDDPPRPWLLLISFAVVGGTAMVYEVAWTRLLSTTLLSSIYGFTVMLATFLVGIVLGSRLFERWVAAGRQVSLATFGFTQSLTGLTALLFLVCFDQLPTWIWALVSGNRTFTGLLIAQFTISALAMLPAALVFGFNFPVVTLLIAQGSKGKERATAIGRAAAANTLGAIIGATAAGFWLVPRLGSFRLVALAAATNLLLAVLMEWRNTPRRTVAVAGNAVLALLVGVLGWWNLLYDPAIANFSTILYRDRYHQALTLREVARTTDLLFAEDGLNASIAVVRSQNYLALRTNGKVDASNADAVTQLTFGHLGMAIHPSPKKVLIIGFGSGMTVNAVAKYKEVERIDCVEIEPAVIRAAKYLEPLNQGVDRDPRVRIILDDARNYLLTTREHYDVIISEPSNPWIAGIASLFTEEFYREVHARLAPGGIFLQWVQAYSLFPDDLRMVVATLTPEFPQVTLWRGMRRDFILLAQTQPGPISLDRWRALWNDPKLRDDYETMGLRRPEGMIGLHLQDDADLRRLVAGAPHNTDNHTLLQYRAPLALFYGNTAEDNHDMLTRSRSSPMPTIVPLDDVRTAAAAGVETLMDINDADLADRYIRVLIKLPPQADTEYIYGRWLLAVRLYKEARKVFENLQQLDPNSPNGTFGLAEVARREHNLDAAEGFLQQVLKQKPEFIPALQSYALIEKERQHWQQACLWQSRRLLAEPNRTPDDLALFGEMLFRANDDQHAEGALVRAIQGDPYHYDANFFLGELYRRQKRWEQARIPLEIVVRYHPARGPAVYSSLANVYRELGRQEESRLILEKGHRLFPDDATINRALAES